MQAADTTREAGRLWNQTPFRSYLFNAFSLLLPSGEQLVIRAMEDAAAHLPQGAALRQEVDHFVQEERAHQRAHRQYNAVLDEQGYEAQALEARIARAAGALESGLSWKDRLALAAALEFLTALVSRQALSSRGWLVEDGSRQSRLWRWHCAEEVAHHRVALRLLQAVGRVGYWRRVGLYVLASVILWGDVVRHLFSFVQTDRSLGRLSWGEAAWSLAGFVVQQWLGLARMAGGWWAYALPLRWLAPASAVQNSASTDLEVRPLCTDDIPRLMVLERKKWNAEQAASADAMARRIAAHPQLCIGAFCVSTGEALASLFLKPISEAQLQSASTWADCVDDGPGTSDQPGRDLFGISLSSVSPKGVDAIFRFFWPRALKAGWRNIYLGSPVPGLARWCRSQPSSQPNVESYISTRRCGLPLDPQLRYYWRKGFRAVVACKPDYFPHPESLNYGVVVRGRIPLSSLAPLWRCLPLPWLQHMGRHLCAVL